MLHPTSTPTQSRRRSSLPKLGLPKLGLPKLGLPKLGLATASFALAVAPFFALAGGVALATTATASASPLVTPQANKPDRIFSKNKKTAKVEAAAGVVTEAGLGGIKFTERGDKTVNVDAARMVQIQWGAVPNSFTDGETYAKRGEWESAVSNFQSAAADSDARDVVKAAARARSIESMMKWGATDPARFTDAIAEADRFMSDHSENWQVPAVRAMKARASWLSGDAPGARDGYKALFEAGKSGTEGYSPLATAEAALEGARAALQSPETSTARELFDSAASAFAAIDTSDTAVMARAKAGEEVARMASAESQLAKGDFDGAARAFESAMRSATTSAGKGAAKLGLGRALLGKGDNVEAQVHLGWVAGLDHTSADRRAAALVALGEALMASPDSIAVAKGALQRVKAEYGATPSAAKATELLSGL